MRPRLERMVEIRDRAFHWLRGDDVVPMLAAAVAGCALVWLMGVVIWVATAP